MDKIKCINCVFNSTDPGFCYAFTIFTDGEIEDYLFALLIFWPITVLIVGILQSIHFIKNTFRGEY